MCNLLLETLPGIETSHGPLMSAWLFFLNNPNITLIALHLVVIIVAVIACKIVKYHG